MSNQPSLPELPPMKAATTATPSPPPVSAPPRAVSGGTRRFRQIVGYLTGGSLVIVGGVVFFELVAKPGLRPSDLAAMVEARVELGVMNQKMGHAPGEHVLTEAQYQEIIAQAQREGAAKAEIGFQRELAAVQADKERVVGAYQTLYQRANAIAQAAIQLETIAQQFRQQLLAMSNGGRSMVIGIKDLFCGLGSPEACASAHQDRATMISESDELSRGDVGKRVRELMQGVDDPATFITREDRRRNGTPKIRH
ncbi:hypothetical protein [Sphingomonas sp. IBVSS2]|uniref:hypothetical protein n=1 Tax=Sphingomonas sp. IBVSS2 TaxID=1985172 RepID=UPI0011817D30|nr:hypothetical protein [Sphingomonas sp. IBVSS2]